MDKPDPNADLKMQLERLHALERDVDTLAASAPAVRQESEPGPPGPIGPMPKHEWDGPLLRFQQGPDGVWGEWSDLQGPMGRAGASYGPGGGGAAPANINAYFPAGW